MVMKAETISESRLELRPTNNQIEFIPSPRPRPYPILLINENRERDHVGKRAEDQAEDKEDQAENQEGNEVEGQARDIGVDQAKHCATNWTKSETLLVSSIRR